jgi:phospholipid/cholesterol/gamma-HCH transport system ATP-binding protein
VIYEGLDLDICEGETMAIIGGSGTGKSVMLKCLIGLIEPDEGSIVYRGQEVTRMSEEELIKLRRNISYVFQLSALFDSLSVFENIAYPLREHFKMTEEEIAQRVEKNLERVGLPGSGHMVPAELSGGMRKRIGLARAIVMEPDVILWDEPTTGLDPTNTKRINELILKMRKELGATNLVVTHDMQSVFMVADRIALLHNKTIAQVSPKRAVREEGESLIMHFAEGEMDGL